MRINKFLAECGVCSRRKGDELVKSGRVSVNKRVITELGFDIDEKNDVVYVDGKKVVLSTHYDYLMFNKPKGCVTTLDESNDFRRPRENDVKVSEKSGSKKFPAINIEKNEDKKPRKTVMDYIDTAKYKRLFPVGRLDYDSEGLLLLTNDGELTFKLTHPSFEIPKTYAVKIEGVIEESDLAILRKGVTVDGVKYGKCKVTVTGADDSSTRLKVVVFEGKNREIRRMFEAVEKKVVFLKRIAIGDLKLGGLSRGGSRELNDTEVQYLLNLCTIQRK